MQFAQRLGNGIGNSLADCAEGIGAEMGIALGRSCVFVPEKCADDRQARAACHGDAGKAVS